jgi:Rrf2 family iron-sulfur cluster assembly transcriptional regulator
MVTRTGRYALRVLGFLAEHEEERIQSREIARRTGIPPNYLSKILHQLSRRGWVSGRKGWGGGFRLEGRARRVPIRKVLELVEGRREPGGCVFGLGDCDPRDPCPLHSHWERIRGAYEEMLRSVTIADLRTGAGG